MPRLIRKARKARRHLAAPLKVAGFVVVVVSAVAAIGVTAARLTGAPTIAERAQSGRSVPAAAPAATAPGEIAFGPAEATAQLFALPPSAPLSSTCGQLEEPFASRAWTRLMLAIVNRRSCLFSLEIARNGENDYGPSGLAGSLFLQLRGDREDVLRHLRIKLNVENPDYEARVFEEARFMLGEVSRRAGFALPPDLLPRLEAQQGFAFERGGIGVTFLAEDLEGERYNLLIKFAKPEAILATDGFGGSMADGSYTKVETAVEKVPLGPVSGRTIDPTLDARAARRLAPR
jgi:Family of unknown function (DUF6030)